MTTTITWNIEKTGLRADIAAFVAAQAAAGKLPANVAAAITDICDDATSSNPRLKLPNGIRLRTSGTLGNGTGQIGMLKADPITLSVPPRPPTPTPGPAPAAPPKPPAEPPAKAA